MPACEQRYLAFSANLMSADTFPLNARHVPSSHQANWWEHELFPPVPLLELVVRINFALATLANRQLYKFYATQNLINILSGL